MGSEMCIRDRYRQDVLNGKNMLSVEWYRSLSELIEGLMKNMFAGMGYSISLVILATLGSLLIHIWPWFGIWVTAGWAQILNGTTVIMMIGTFRYALGPYGVKLWHGLLLPFTITLFIYIQWRATFLTIKNGGIFWRETFYSLQKLQSNKV